MNPLYEMMKDNDYPPIVQQFLQFKRNFNGDARAQVQELLNSGKISQQQYDDAVKQARQIQEMLSSSGRR